MTLTIREILQGQKKRHRKGSGLEARWCDWCGQQYPCADRLDAVAALKALDEAEGIGPTIGQPHAPIHTRLVADPAPPTENT